MINIEVEEYVHMMNTPGFNEESKNNIQQTENILVISK